MTAGENPGCTFRQQANLVGLGIVVGLVIAVVAFGGWKIYRAMQPSALVAAIAPPASSTSGDKKNTEDCKTIEAYAPKIKKKLGLPESIQKDDSISVIATADVPRTEHPLIASALLNRGTGVGEIAFTPQPLPWLARGNGLAVGALWGASDETTGAVRIYARYELAQTKRVRWLAGGSLETGARWFAGVGAEFR